MLGRAALVFPALVLACGACRPAAPGAPLQRLLPGLGTPTHRKIPPMLATGDMLAREQESRPAILLKPGERRTLRVVAPPGARLVFAWAPGPGAPERAFVRFSVEVDGAPAYSKRMFAGLRQRWHRASLALPRAGELTLSFEGRHVLADGSAAGDTPDTPWIMLASPRVEGRLGRPRRVLVWVSQDTVRADHLGSYGYSRPTSPNFDRLTREAVLFEAAVASAPWTLPSLTSQFTSRHASSHGAVLPASPRRTGQLTVFEALADAGFTTLGVTGNAFVSVDFNLAAGFDALYYTPGTAADVNRLALRALDELGDNDLALFVHYMDPHTDYAPPAPFDRLFDPDYRGNVTGGNFFSLAKTGAEIEHVKALYDAELAYTDQQLGLLLAELERRGLLEDAVLAFSADHGEELKDHGAWTHSQTLYEEALHVPFAIRLPGIPPQRVARPVALIDLAPSVLEALGIKPPAGFEGQSLLPLLQGQAHAERPIYAETNRSVGDLNHKLAIREGWLKYVVVTPRANPDRAHIVDERLYDLRADPKEQAPLREHPALAGFREAAFAFLTRAAGRGDGRSLPLAPDVEERLRALGYLQ